MNKKGLPIVLAIVGAIGTIGTGVAAAMETPKAVERLKVLKEEKDSKLKALDYIKWFAKSYWKTTLVGGMSVASVTVGTVISQKQQASLAATCMLLKSGFDRYKGKVKEVLGIESHKDILKAIAREDAEKVTVPDNKRLYYEEHIGTFLADPESVAYAYADLNQRLYCDEYGRQNNDEATLYDFVLMSGAELLDDQGNKIKKDIKKAFINFGWTADYLYENFEYGWIHMSIDEDRSDESKPSIYHISFFEEPILLPYEEKDDIRSEPFYPKIVPEGVEHEED